MPTTDTSGSIIGLPALKRRLVALPGRIERDGMEEPLKRTTGNAAARLRPATPVRSGRARRDIRVIVKSTKGVGAYGVVSYRGARSRRAMRIYERGSRRQKARPFFGRASSGVAREATDAVAAGLRKAVG